MSNVTHPNLNKELKMAEINKLNAETARLQAETARLNAETLKLQKETKHYPTVVIISAVVGGALTAIIGFLGVVVGLIAK
ncbi:MAG: hypothetical protein Q3971_03000 [Moraxella sp.]|nr:hypothetical protein [Moraxella sp.]